MPPFTKRRSAAGEGHVAKDGPLVVLTGQHTGRSATDKFVVKDAQTEPHVWWDNNKAMTPAHFDALYADMMAFARRQGVVRQGSVRRRRPHPSHQGAHRHRICLAFAVRASAPDPARRRRAQEFRSRIHHHRPAQFQRRSREAWLGQRHGGRGQFHQEADPDRRHLLCRRDEEIGLHHSQLHPAAQAGGADALLGQCRQGWQKRHIFRSFRHRQDHAFSRCVAHFGGRRRTWLGRTWRLQFRRRLLCQGDPALARGRTGNLSPPPNASARCWRMW